MEMKANGSRRRSAAPTIGLAAYDRKPCQKNLKVDSTLATDMEQASEVALLARNAIRCALLNPGVIGFQALALAAHYSRRHRALVGRARR
jgi:hypothetical protein